MFQKDLVLEKNDFLQGKHTPNWETPHCDDRLPHLLTQILVPFSYQTFLRPPRFSFPRLPEGSPGLSSMALQDEKRGPSHGHSSMGSQQDGLSLKKGRVKNDFSSSSSLHPTQQACDKRNELCSLLSPSLFPWASQSDLTLPDRLQRSLFSLLAPKHLYLLSPPACSLSCSLPSFSQFLTAPPSYTKRCLSGRSRVAISPPFLKTCLARLSPSSKIHSTLHSYVSYHV